MKVLISGFEPFGGRKTNPTSLLIDAVKKNEVPYPQDMIVDTVILPVSFFDSYSKLNDKVNEFNPDVILAFGQADNIDTIDLESIALNKMHADIQDNHGYQPLNKSINQTGPDLYLSTLPILGIEGALTAEEIPVKISNSAGTFVCNYVFYKMMEDNQESLRLCGFIHVPTLDIDKNESGPSISFDVLKKALSIMLNYINY